MNFPKELRYSKDHEWIRIDGNEAYVGITDFAQSELGDITYVDVFSVGETLEADEVFGSLDAVKTVSDLFIPVGAEILESNPELEDAPELVNSDPYGKGWIVKVKVLDPSQLNTLLDAAAYQALVKK